MIGWTRAPRTRVLGKRQGSIPPTSPTPPSVSALLEYLTERGATLEQLVDAHRAGSLPGFGRRVGHAGQDADGDRGGDRAAQRCPGTHACCARCWPPASPRSPTPRSRRTCSASWRPSSRAPRSWARRRSWPSPACSGQPPSTWPSPPSHCSSPSSVRAPCARGPTSSPAPGSPRRRRERSSVCPTCSATWSWKRSSAPSDGCKRRGPGWTDPGGGVGTDGATEVVALGFVDLVGSTAWAESLDLRDQSLALTRFESAAWSSAVLAGGRVVKMIGDEVFFAAPTADAACRIGLEVCEAAGADHALPPARGAVGFGPVDPPRGRLLRAAGQPRRPPGQGRAARRARRDRGGRRHADARQMDGRAARTGRTPGHRGSHTRVPRGASRPRSLTIFCVCGPVFTPTAIRRSPYGRVLTHWVITPVNTARYC